MHVYAHIFEGVVWEIIDPMQDSDGVEIPLSNRYTQEFCETCIDVTDVTPRPECGWTAIEKDGTWTFAAPPLS